VGKSSAGRHDIHDPVRQMVRANMLRNEEGQGEEKVIGSLERAEMFSRGLAEAARRSRFSTKTRRRLTATYGFAARRGEIAIRTFYIVTFIVVALIPALSGIFYFGLIASNQYVVEEKFTVRGGEVPKLDGIGMLTGLPSLAVVQDSQIVANYIYSRALVEELEKRVSLRQLYSYHDVDWPARFERSKPIEKLVAFWKSMVEVSIQIPSGIIVVSVRAFRAQDAVVIGTAIIDLSEKLVNDMNERMRRDSVAASEQELTRAVERVGKARIELEKARNSEGMLDAGQTAVAINALIGNLQADQLRLQQEYDTQVRNVSEQAPQMRALKARITATASQVEQLKAQMTTQNGGASDRVLSESMTRFSELGLEYQIAEKQYAAAAAALEVARASSERKQVYLSTFVRPALPEEPLYPKRVVYSFFTIIAAIGSWATLCSIVTAIRNYMA
jgi:capsular polysaccharide transport system permease protein